MVFDAKTAIVTWFLLIVIAVLLWYRNIDSDRIFSVYAALIGVVMLIIYGVHSGMDPQIAGRLAYTLIWVFILAAMALVYVFTGNNVAGIITLVIVVVAIVAVYFTLTHDYRIDLSGNLREAPLWVSSYWGSNMIYIMGIALVTPLLVLAVIQESIWLYCTVGFIVIAGIVSTLVYPGNSSQATSVWFYALSALILFAWVIGMIGTEQLNIT